MAVTIAPVLEYNVWYDFIWHLKISDNINDGRFRCWLNGKLARAYNVTTLQKWVIPTVVTAGVSDRWVCPPATIGVFQQTVDDGIPVSVCDFTGKTHRDVSLSANIDLEFRIGVYKYGWSYLYQDPPPGATPSGIIDYIVWFDNVKVALPTNTDYEIFKQLSYNGADPIDGIEIPSSIYTINTSSTTGGSVSQSPIGTSFISGTSITLTATPDSGFTFSRFRNTATNQTLSLSSFYSFNLTENISIEAVFVADSVPTTGRKFFGRKKPIV
jgi:hypothetical protein